MKIAPRPAAFDTPDTTGPGSPTAGTGSGTTQISDIYGPGCAQVPTEGEGSAQGVVDDPVGTAASDNPLLGTLTTAVAEAGLVDTLNDGSAAYTVFAPADPAFEAPPAGTLDTLSADPDGQRKAGTVTTVQGEQLAITGEPTTLTIDEQEQEQEQASVLCGNIPAANATVSVIDAVQMPPAA